MTARGEELIGEATQMALTNFNVSGRPIPILVVHALARIKAAMAQANARLAGAETG